MLSCIDKILKLVTVILSFRVTKCCILLVNVNTVVTQLIPTIRKQKISPFVKRYRCFVYINCVKTAIYLTFVVLSLFESFISNRSQASDTLDRHNSITGGHILSAKKESNR